MIELPGYWKELEPYGVKGVEENPTPPEPWIQATVKCRRYSFSGTVDFLIDTGCTLTTIMPADRKRLALLPAYLEDGEPKSFGGIGSSGLPIRHLVAVELEFIDINRKRVLIALPRILVAYIPQKVSSAAAHRESILGRDVLQHCLLDLTGKTPRLQCVSGFHESNPESRHG
jgi:hypothetical protein